MKKTSSFRRATGLTLAMALSWGLTSATPASGEPAGPAGDALGLPADTDTYASASAPATNYGDSSTIKVDGAPEYITYLRFTIPAEVTEVGTARLRLYATNASRDGGIVYRVEDTAWDEGSVTWDARPALGAALSPVGVVPSSGWVEIDITGWLTGPGAHSLAIATAYDDGSAFVSSEGVPEQRPELVVAAGALPTTLSLAPHADAYVNDSSPDANYGDSTTLRVDGTPRYAMYLLFSIPPALAQVATARLRLFATNGSRDGGFVYRLGDTAWEEHLVTWNSGPALGTPLAPVGLAPGTGLVEIDLTGWVIAPGVHSLAIVTSSEDGSAYASRHGAADRLPHLVVTTGPVPETLTLAPDADAYANAASPDTAYGTSTTLRVDGSPQYVTYLRFTIPPAITEVASATLRLFATNGSNVGGTVHRVDNTSWLEGSLTWNARPALGVAMATVGPVPSTGWVQVDLSGLLTSAGTHSLAIATPTGDGSAFVSRHSAPDQRPQLVVVAGSDQPPGTPPGLAGTAPSGFRVDLSWQPSTDDHQVIGYRVYRDDDEIAQTPLTTYFDSTARPDQTYQYSVRAYDSAGRLSEPAEPATVTTPTYSGDPVIAAAGDAACDPDDPDFNGGAGTALRCHHSATSDLLTDPRLAAVLGLGDLQNLVNQNNAREKWDLSYHPTWGRTRAITWPAVGNHDYKVPDATGYFDYWGPVAGDPAQGYYSFELANWHMVVLNSQCVEVGGCAAGSAQETWLRADLAAHPANCTLAYWHNPKFSSKLPSATYDAFWTALYEAGAEVVLVGHAEHYERFAPLTTTGQLDTERGIRQFVVGTGGEELRSFGPPAPNSEVRNNDTFGVLELTLRPTEYEWRFVPESGGTFTDVGSGTCH